MINILIIEDRKKRSLILDLNFKIYLEAKSTLITSSTQLKKVLSGEGLPKWDLIVCREKIGDQSILDMLNSKIDGLGINLPIVIQLDAKKKKRVDDIEKFIYVEENSLLKNILAPVAKMFEITPTQMAEYEVPDPYPVDSALLDYFISAPCDIYTDEEREHSILREGEMIEKGLLLGLTGGGDVYIDASKRTQFANTFTEQFAHMASLLSNPEIDVQKKMEALDKTLEFLSKEFQSGGMSEEVAELSHQCITSMVELNLSSKDLQGIQKLLMSEAFGQRFLTAQLIIFYSLHMIKVLDWILEDPELNIPYAAFFHDLMLESDAWAVVRSNEALNDAPFDESQKELIERHAELTAKFFEGWDSIPDEACRVIKEHHGSTEGRGFRKDLSKLSNLSKSFLIAEEWAVRCLPFYRGKEKEVDKKKVLSSMKKLFAGKGYSELIGALELLEVVDLAKIVEYWQQQDSLILQEFSLDQKIAESKVFTIEDKEKWEIVSFIHHRLEKIKEQGEHLLEEYDRDLIRSTLEKSSYIYRIVEGAFGDKKDIESIEPEVLEQLSDCYEYYIGNLKKVYEIVHNFRLSRDIKETDLMLAAGAGKLFMCKLLLESKIEEVDLINLEGMTALHYAVVNNEKEVVDYLLHKGAKMDQVDRMRRGPLYHSLTHGHEEMFFHLVEKGARPNQQAVGGVSLCMVCALKGCYEALEYLVKKTKADLGAQDANKKTVVDYAKKGGNQKIIDFVTNNI